MDTDTILTDTILSLTIFYHLSYLPRIKSSYQKEKEQENKIRTDRNEEQRTGEEHS